MTTASTSEERRRTGSGSTDAQPFGSATLAVGRVVSSNGDGVCVLLVGPEGRLLQAELAKSCLVAPDVSDLVLLTQMGDIAFVLAVLRGSDASQDVTISARGDLKMEGAGRVSIVGKQGVGIASGADVSLVGGAVDVSAAQLRASFDSIISVGREALLEVESFRSVAVVVDRVAERVRDRVQRLYRFVHTETVRAERIDCDAKHGVYVRGENVVVAADDLAKLDGEHIHLG